MIDLLANTRLLQILGIAILSLCCATSAADEYRDLTADDLTGSWELTVEGVDVQMVVWPGKDFGEAPRLIGILYTPQYDCLQFTSISIAKFPNKVYGHTDHYGAVFSETQSLVRPDYRGGVSNSGDCMVEAGQLSRPGIVAFRGWMGISADGVISSDVMQTAHKDPADLTSRYSLGEESSPLTLRPAPLSKEMGRWLDQVEAGKFRKIRLDVYPLAPHRSSF